MINFCPLAGIPSYNRLRREIIQNLIQNYTKTLFRYSDFFRFFRYKKNPRANHFEIQISAISVISAGQKKHYQWDKKSLSTGNNKFLCFLCFGFAFLLLARQSLYKYNFVLARSSVLCEIKSKNIFLR